MNLRDPKYGQRRPPEAWVAVVLLALILSLAPALDRATELAMSNGTNGQPAKVLDLCAVPGLLIAPLVLRPAQLAAPVAGGVILHPPSPLVRVTDHPPRPA